VLVEAWPGDPAVLDRLLGPPSRRGSSRGPTVATVPDKRQDSKQRRAARNRASRDALAARRENAETSRTTTSSSSSSGSTRSGGSGRAAAPKLSAAPPPNGVMGMLSSSRPGDRAVMLSVLLALVALVFVLFAKIPVDDRGEPFPRSFGGVAHVARETVTGDSLPDRKESLISVGGPVVLVFALVPVAITLFAAFWANRRPDRSRWLTYSMFAMAAVVFLSINVSVFFLAPLLALGWASFQARKADLPARVAERVVPPERGRRGRRVIDAESREVSDDEAPVDEPVTSDEEPDPLDELEAEMQAEDQVDETDVGDNGRKPSS
jgi:hypothetical protein